LKSTTQQIAENVAA